MSASKTVSCEQDFFFFHRSVIVHDCYCRKLTLLLAYNTRAPTQRLFQREEVATAWECRRSEIAPCVGPCLGWVFFFLHLFRFGCHCLCKISMFLFPFFFFSHKKWPGTQTCFVDSSVPWGILHDPKKKNKINWGGKVLIASHSHTEEKKSDSPFFILREENDTKNITWWKKIGKEKKVGAN